MTLEIRSRLEFTKDDGLSTMHFLKGIISLLSRYLCYVFSLTFNISLHIVYISYVCQLAFKILSLHISNKTVAFLNTKVFKYLSIIKEVLVIYMNTLLRRKHVWWSMFAVIILVFYTMTVHGRE